MGGQTGLGAPGLLIQDGGEDTPLCPLLPVLPVITFCHMESELDVELNSGQRGVAIVPVTFKVPLAHGSRGTLGAKVFTDMPRACASHR